MLFSLMVAVLTLWTCKDDHPVEPLPDFSSKLEQQIVHSPSLVGNFYGDPVDRKVMVYTPPGYNPEGSEKYPVIYLFHSLPFSDSAFISSEPWEEWADVITDLPEFPQQGFVAWIDTMIAHGVLAPSIIVMPETKTHYGFSFYTNSELLGNYEDYIINDLVPYIDGHYKTIATRDGRAVIGHSQGAYGAMRMGLLHSNTFSVVAAHAGPLYFDLMKGATAYVIAENPDGMTGPAHNKFLTSVIYGMAAAWSPNLQNPPYYVDLPFVYPTGANIPEVWNRWLENDPFTLLNTHTDDLKSLRGIYIDCGTSDSWYEVSNLYHQQLTARSVDHTFQSYSGTHFNKLFSRLEISLAFCSEHLQQ